MDDVERIMARNVKRALAERGWRHRDLAQQMNRHGFPWSTNRVAQVACEYRALNITDVIGLCRALSVPFEYFLEGAESVLPTGPVDIPTDDERRAAAHLEVDVPQLRRLSQRLFGTPDVTIERDRRAGGAATGRTSRADQTRRGHAMRGILTELQAA